MYPPRKTLPPIAPALHQADQSISQNAGRLGKLLSNPILRKADGGRISQSVDAMKLVKDAIDSLHNNDTAAARSTIRMLNDPQVTAAASTIGQGSTGVKLAIQKLENLVESLSNSSQVPMLKKGGRVKG